MEGVWGAVLMLVVSGLLAIGRVEGGSATAQCVQVGQAGLGPGVPAAYTIGGKDLSVKSADKMNLVPLATLGAKKFYFRDQQNHGNGIDWRNRTCKQGGYWLNVGATSKDDGKTWGTKPGHVIGPGTEYCSGKVDIRTYLVHQDGIALRGWLYVEVELTKEADTGQIPVTGVNSTDSMEYIYVQARDEVFNAIGEFVSPDEIPDDEQCQKQSEQDLIRPSPFNLLPCSATGAREAKTSGAIFMARKSQYEVQWAKDNAISKDKDKDDKVKDLTRGIRFMWRLNEYWCNRHEKFRFDVFVWTEKNENIAQGNKQGKCNTMLNRPSSDVSTGLVQNYTYPPPNELDTEEPWKNPIFQLCRLYEKSTDWFQTHWFGAADIKTPGQKLDCSIRINENGETAIPKGGENWLEKIIPLTIGEDFVALDKFSLRYQDVFTEEQLDKLGAKATDTYTVIVKANSRVYTFVQGCQVNPIPDARRGVDSADQIRTFGGRCENQIFKDANTTTYQKCNTDDSALEFTNFASLHSTWDNYTYYTQTIMTGRTKACSVDCVDPSTDDHFNEIKNTKLPTSGGDGATEDKLPPVSGKVVLEARRISRETTFWQVRKYHGNLCIFFTMFIIPVCLFITRYYKETFMHGRCASCPPWLWVHLFMCIAVLTLFRSSFSAMRETIYSWGRQLDGDSDFHRLVGYIFVGIFFAMTAVGGLRPIPRMPRLITCAMHSAVGFALYLLALGLIMHSPNIPGSPSVDICYENDSVKDEAIKNGTAVTVHKVTIYAVVWLVLDIIFHTLLTIFQVITDKRTGIERPGFGFPFIPFLPPNSNRDYQGSRVRKVVLVLYVIVAFIMTFLTMADIFDNDLDSESGNHKFCKPWNVTTCNIRDNPFGCTALQRQYFNIVSARYNITWEDEDDEG